jgi:hypothetical protein
LNLVIAAQRRKRDRASGKWRLRGGQTLATWFGRAVNNAELNGTQRRM